MKEKQKYTQMIDDDKQRHGNKQFEQKNKQKKNNHDEMEFNKCSQFTVIILKQKRCTTKLSRRLLLSTVSSLSVTLSTKIFTYRMGDPTCSSVTHNGK